MKFCPQCNSSLEYIEEEGKLKEKCKNCLYSANTKDMLIDQTVYRSETKSGDRKQYLIYDNTIPRTSKVECPNSDCPSRKNRDLQEAIFYNDNVTLKIIHICVVCEVEWSYS